MIHRLLYCSYEELERWRTYMASDNQLLEKEKVLDIGEYDAKFKENLQRLLSEIYNPSIPFAPTSELKRCTYCAYRQLCDRNVPATSKG